MNPKKMIISAFSLLIGLSMSAQIPSPSQWTYKATKGEIRIGDEIDLVFKVQLDKTWHLYSNLQNYKIGPLPTVFKFEPNTGYELIGKIIPVDPKKEYDEIFEVDVNYFENKAEFRQKVKILARETVIRGTYSYQVCSALDGKCIPGDGEFEFKINATN